MKLGAATGLSPPDIGETEYSYPGIELHRISFPANQFGPTIAILHNGPVGNNASPISASKQRINARRSPFP
jgi:hypothetical protein